MNSSPSQASIAPGQPPPYKEVEAEISDPLERPSALTVQLQVWHHRSEGRSPANNDKFAALFRNLQNWEVVPLEVDGVTGLSAHDQYVPVEVGESRRLEPLQFSIRSFARDRRKAYPHCP